MTIAALLLSAFLGSTPTDAATVATRVAWQGRYEEARGGLSAALEATSAACARASLLVRLSGIENEESMFRGTGSDGLATAERALAEARRCGDRVIEADAVEAIGRARYNRRFAGEEPDFSGAHARFVEALALREAAKAGATAIAWSHFRLGLVHEQQEQLPQAEARYRSAMTLATPAGDDLLLSYLYRHLASFEKGARGAAGELEFHRRSLELRERIGFVGGAVFARIAVADTLAGMGRGDEALQAWDAARTAAASANLHRGVATASLAIAGARAARGEKAAARSAYEAAAAAATAMSDVAAAGEARAKARQLR